MSQGKKELVDMLMKWRYSGFNVHLFDKNSLFNGASIGGMELCVK